MNQVAVNQEPFCTLSNFPIKRIFACNLHTSREKVNVIHVNVSFQDLILMHSFELGTISCYFQTSSFDSCSDIANVLF